MPSLRQKSDGRYFIDYRDADGIRQRPYIQIDGQPCRDAAMAERFYAEWIRLNNVPSTAPTATRATSPRIADILQYYRDVYLRATNAATASHAAAATHCEVFAAWCRAQNIGRTQQLSTETLTRWAAELQVTHKPRTTANYMNTIRAALNVAVDAGLIPASPVKKWNKPRFDATDKHPLSLAELRAVIQLFHDVPVVLWMCYTGQRPSDARTLKFGDVDIPTRTVHRPSMKVRALRKFEICAEAAAVVEACAARAHHPGDVVFVAANGAPWGEDGPLNAMKRRCVAVNHPRLVTPKMLRDSFGTIMANDVGLPLPELQILMGHTDIKTTMQYVRARGARKWLDVFDTEFREPAPTAG